MSTTCHWSVALVATVLASTWLCSAASRLPYPSLSLVEGALSTTAKDDFDGDTKTFEAAVKWNGEKLQAGSSSDQNNTIRAPHLACAGYGHGSEIFSRLKELLSPEAVRLVSHSKEYGVCFIATASDTQAAAIAAELPGQIGLESFAPFPSAMKLAPGLLEHQQSSHFDRLTANHGASMRLSNVEGLTVEFSPGTLPAHSSEADSFTGDFLSDIMSDSINLHSTNFWSDPTLSELANVGDTSGGAVRRRNWSMAASVVHELSKSGGTSPGDICSWNGVAANQVATDVLLLSGLDHLLYSGKGAGGNGQEATELHVACFMGLLSFLASKDQVLRVAPTHSKRLLDATARAIIQTATSTDTPLTAAGLNGTGEVIQVTDSGLDETSCFFIDGDGQEVTHGYYYDALGFSTSGSSSASYYYSTAVYQVFRGGDFSSYPNRRKIIQYIDMLKPDSTSSVSGYYFLPADGFGDDDKAGHGTHTAGTAAGATLNTPAETVSCDAGETLSCVGACIDSTGSDDDLVTYSYQDPDIDRLCPMLGCDDDSELCLGDDVGATLAANGGMAQGAKLAIFDIFAGDTGMTDIIGNGLWEPCLEAGCKIHSNSWGSDGMCLLSTIDIVYDDFMYQNTENLLLFAAGNDGDNSFDAECTIGSPAIAKNVLAIGATSAGETRLNTEETHDIDHVAHFSSWGFTTDGRIKPEVVAPGDMIYSAAGDGTDTHSCRLWAYEGTSMSTPVAAGASAMIRQYFVDESFYAADVISRGFCNDGFLCQGFSPSSATIKAVLINSANLMGGASDPDGLRGFGRIHLENGVPLGGEGNLALFVADGGNTSISEFSQQEYLFDVDADAGLSFRATLSWIDPPATTLSAAQLVHDLDLAVVSPSGTTHTMWSSGEKDVVNVNERVVVDAADVESGTWTVWVSSNSLTTPSQSYSLVVNGAISPGTGEGATPRADSDSIATVHFPKWLSMALCVVSSITAGAWAV